MNFNYHYLLTCAHLSVLFLRRASLNARCLLGEMLSVSGSETTGSHTPSMKTALCRLAILAYTLPQWQQLLCRYAGQIHTALQDTRLNKIKHI